MTIDRRYSVTEGTAVKAPCRAATTANITLLGEQTIDGVSVVADDRVLVKNQTTGSENGIYVASTGNWTRARDFDGAYDIVTGTRVFITAGSVNASYEYAVSTTGAITIDTTSIAFTSTGAASAAASATAASASAVAAAASAVTAASYTFTTGDIKLTLKTTADSGWRLFDDGTIGDASSGATYANILAVDLFTLLFNNTVDANCALLTSAGAGTTRAAQVSAALAWAAHCRMSLPKALGRALAVAGSGSGLTARALSVTAGAETVVLATTDIPSHNHPVFLNDPGHVHAVDVGSSGGGSDQVTQGVAGVGSTVTGPVNSNTTGITVRDTAGGGGTAEQTATTGGGGAHANVQPTVFLNCMVKL